jgi:hypothetical protein
MIYPRSKPIIRRPISAEEAKRSSPSPSPSPAPGPSSPSSPVNIGDKPPKNPSRSGSPHAHTQQLGGRTGGQGSKDDIFLKSRVDQSLHLMKLIYEKAGEPTRPGGHSQFDALGALKSEMAFKILNKKRWADFFEEIKEHEEG